MMRVGMIIVGIIEIILGYWLGSNFSNFQIIGGALFGGGLKAIIISVFVMKRR